MRSYSQAKVTQAAAIKRNPLLPFSHTFGLKVVNHPANPGGLQ